MRSRTPETAHDGVRFYWDTLNKSEQALTEHHADNLAEHSNNALRAGDYVGTVLTPLLISEEGNLAHTIHQIRQQKAGNGLIIAANFPKDGHRMEVIERNVAAMIQYQASHPSFPFGFYFADYPAGTPIGQIVREMYSTTLKQLGTTFGRRLPNMPLIRWDADAVSATPDYLKNLITTHYKLDRSNLMLYPVVQHDRLDPQKYPNLNRTLDWYDLFLYRGRSITSSHNSVDVLGYAASGGLDPNVAIAEIGNIGDSMRRTKHLPLLRTSCLANAIATVSCRRITHRSVTEGIPVYGEMFMSEEGQYNHRSEMPSRDLTDREYHQQSGWRAIHEVHCEGDSAYRAVLDSGAAEDIARRQALDTMRAFGRSILSTIGDTPGMSRIIEGAISHWEHAGPPAGQAHREVPLLKLTRLHAARIAQTTGMLS